MAVDNDICQTRCGLLNWRPAFLQPLNRPTTYAIVLAMTLFATNMIKGMYQINMSTLQRLLNMSSKDMSLIIISNDISATLVAFFLGHFSSSKKIRWLSFGVIVCIISCLLTSGTQLLIELPEKINQNNQSSNKTNFAVCQTNRPHDIPLDLGQSEPAETYATRNEPLFWCLFLSGIILGIGSTHDITGVTYLDEIVPQQHLGAILGCIKVFEFVSMPISYTIGGLLLTQYVTLTAPPPGAEMGNSLWVGAWWLGFLIPAMILAVFGLPIILFPQHMPAAQEVLRKKVACGQTTIEEKEKELNQSFKDLARDLQPTMKRLMKNTSLVFLVLSFVLTWLSIGAFPYEAKLYSIIFKTTVADIGQINGIIKTVAGVLGPLLSGGIILKYKLSGKKCVFLIAVLELMCLPGLFMYLNYCQPDNLAGITASYAGEAPNFIRNLTNECNSVCECSRELYEPVCDTTADKTYFSPCYAGCTSHSESNDTVVYSSCNCTVAGVTVNKGLCPPEESCNMKKWVTLIGNSISFLLLVAVSPLGDLAFLRIVPEIDRSATQGLKTFCCSLLGLIPGPIIFGAIIDSYCIVWTGNQPGSGSCLAYDIQSLMPIHVAVQVSMRCGGIICCIISWYLYPNESKRERHKDPQTKLGIVISNR